MRYALLLLLFAQAAVLAQDAEVTVPKDRPVAPAADPTVVAFDDLVKEHQAETKKFFQDFQEARKKNPALPYRFDNHPDRKWGARYDDFAAKHAGTARSTVVPRQSRSNTG